LTFTLFTFDLLIKSTMKKIFVFALVAASIGACKKSTSPDTLSPLITVTSPSPNQQFGSGATVTIAASVLENRKLRMVHLTVTNKNNNTQVLEVHEETSESTYQVSKTFVTGSFTLYAVLIEAEDLAGNKSQVNFEVRSN
jgi:hypothetical protein